MRSPFAVLREIRYHSRRVERNGFDRVQEAGFIVFAFVAPFAVWKMETAVVRTTTEALQTIRVFEGIDDTGRSEGIRAIALKPEDEDQPWPRSLPLAEVAVVQRTEWCGWPLVTSDTVSMPELLIERFPACRESREPAVRRAAEALVASPAVAADAPRTRTHPASWMFSWGAWWVMMVFALAVLLAPLRFAFFALRRGRTVLRQSRIDRCHCPNCGYNAKHSILQGRCPECGSELYERPDYH